MAAPTPAGNPRRLALYATVLCALTAVAAVVSFVRGDWFGIVWVALAGLSSNMAWYYGRRARAQGADRRTPA
ncbi:hypothetical protein RM844_00935 [Streptomyces sp. DSM 44915]|uniref:Secreted protein n=1 Tax=Streptomyces chisholmiae TaxID=3075540 RepID=A0ABU2JKS0_9ACTN|nr:hypothetical protein [Streptomyces sp. DSM 44915]MDT0264848.1 hypothetical protein [Streptomyces sp. DSM 44915]